MSKVETTDNKNKYFEENAVNFDISLTHLKIECICVCQIFGGIITMYYNEKQGCYKKYVMIIAVSFFLLQKQYYFLA